MTALLVYLLLGCWCALGLSFHGRWKGKGRLPAGPALGTVLLWWVPILLALFELFDEALVGDVSLESEEDAHG